MEVKNWNKFAYESGIKYHFAEVGTENIVIKADDRAFWFTTDREYVFDKKYKSPIYVAGDSVYFISPANTLTSIQITKSETEYGRLQNVDMRVTLRYLRDIRAL